MKKLMFAAVVGTLAGVASADLIKVEDKPIAVDKVQLKLKAVDQKLDSVSYSGLLFWKSENEAPTLYAWNAKTGKMADKEMSYTYSTAAGGKTIKVKKPFNPRFIEQITFDNENVSKDTKKMGVGFTMSGNKAGKMVAYGAGKVAKLFTKKGVSLSGNIVAQEDFAYGTWKLSAMTVKDGWTVADVLAKNKVEMGL